MHLLAFLLNRPGSRNLGNEGVSGASDIGETGDNARERTLANDNQGGIEHGNALSRSLECRGLLGDGLDTIGNLPAAKGGQNPRCHGNASEDLGEMHFGGIDD